MVETNNRSNLLNLNDIQVGFENNIPKKLKIIFSQYKHSEIGQSATRIVPAYENRCCPVKLFTSYLTLRATVVLPQSNNTIFIWASGEVVKATQANSLLKKLINITKLDSSAFTFHSLRIGGTTEAAMRGATDSQLQHMGRWKSAAFRQYVRPEQVYFKY